MSKEHVCGLNGYNPMIDDPCPACEDNEVERGLTRTRCAHDVRIREGEVDCLYCARNSLEHLRQKQAEALADLNEHFKKVEALLNWAEFAHDVTCDRVCREGDLYSPPCSCNHDEVLYALNVSATREKLQKLLSS